VEELSENDMESHSHPALPISMKDALLRTIMKDNRHGNIKSSVERSETPDKTIISKKTTKNDIRTPVRTSVTDGQWRKRGTLPPVQLFSSGVERSPAPSPDPDPVRPAVSTTPILPESLLASTIRHNKSITHSKSKAGPAKSSTSVSGLVSGEPTRPPYLPTPILPPTMTRSGNAQGNVRPSIEEPLTNLKRSYPPTVDGEDDSTFSTKRRKKVTSTGSPIHKLLFKNDNETLKNRNEDWEINGGKLKAVNERNDNHDKKESE
jgi:hypothetical protein